MKTINWAAMDSYDTTVILALSLKTSDTYFQNSYTTSFIHHVTITILTTTIRIWWLFFPYNISLSCLKESNKIQRYYESKQNSKYRDSQNSNISCTRSWVFSTSLFSDSWWKNWSVYFQLWNHLFNFFLQCYIFFYTDAHTWRKIVNRNLCSCWHSVTRSCHFICLCCDVTFRGFICRYFFSWLWRVNWFCSNFCCCCWDNALCLEWDEGKKVLNLCRF